MGPTIKLALFLCCLPIITSWPVNEHVSGDYFPRSISSNEESAPETPPASLNPAPLFISNIPPVEFQHFVPLETSTDGDDSQSYHAYDVDNSEAHDDSEGATTTSDVAAEDYRPKYDAILKLIGTKSKYSHDKDQVGIPGKESRFRRDAGAGPSSGSVAYSQASSSSSSGGDGSVYFGNQGFGGFDNGFVQRSLDSFGVNQFGQGGFGQGGFGQGGFGGGGFGGSQADSSASAQSGGNSGGIGVRYQDDGNYGYRQNVGGYGDHQNGYDDGNVLLRIGSSDDDATSSVGGSGTTGAKCVASQSSSSVDSNGKATYSVNAGKC